MDQNTLVVYDTWSGNTERIARAIAAGLRTQAVHVDENPPTPRFLVVGSYVHFGASPKVKRYLRGRKPQSMAIFVTHGVGGRFGAATSQMAIDEMTIPDVPVIGTFLCRGNHILLRTSINHPDVTDVNNAKMFGERIEPGLGYVIVPWVSQNLPFACGISQGIQRGMSPDDYRHDPNNWCSSPMWYKRGYEIGYRLRDPYMYF